MFTGSIVALITPMTENGEIDYPSLKKLVDFHVDAGTDGIVAVGTTGESATLPAQEHIKVVQEIINFAEGRIPVIAGTGANSTSEAIELNDAIAPLGVDGFLSVVPYYNKPQQGGLVKHFQAIADNTDVPILLYNVPGRTVTDMLPAAVAELSLHKNIVGIKEATGNMQRLIDIKKLVADDFVLLSGDDETAFEFVRLGGHGVISVTANIEPARMAKMIQLTREGQIEAGREIDLILNPLHTGLFIEPNPVLPKWALYRMGLIQSDYLRLPLIQAELANQKTIEQVMIDIGTIK
ncbi:4-hydroxy-tetrahydrodipicolinate synthase [Alteromonadaceae bacterium BrNp21-10]|nr:4-hydroxy-tetrahydrodipicolinate synthase [Alteromonadaceae bacterium BrNp21-10]